MGSPSFGLRLFGYNVNDVNEEISRVDREYFETLCELEIKTRKYLDENLKLKEEIRALKRNRGSSSMQPEFLNAAVKNAERFIELYQNFTDEEIERLDEKERRITQIYNEKLAAIDLEIKTTQKVIGVALETILNKASGVSIAEELEGIKALNTPAPTITDITTVKDIPDNQPVQTLSPKDESPFVAPEAPVYKAPEPLKAVVPIKATLPSVSIPSVSKAVSAIDLTAVSPQTVVPAIEPEKPSVPAVPAPQKVQNIPAPKAVTWVPLMKIEPISYLTPEDFEEVEISTASTVETLAPSPVTPAVPVQDLREYKVSMPFRQVESDISVSK